MKAAFGSMAVFGSCWRKYDYAEGERFHQHLERCVRGEVRDENMEGGFMK